MVTSCYYYQPTTKLVLVNVSAYRNSIIPLTNSQNDDIHILTKSLFFCTHILGQPACISASSITTIQNSQNTALYTLPYSHLTPKILHKRHIHEKMKSNAFAGHLMLTRMDTQISHNFDRPFVWPATQFLSLVHSRKPTKSRCPSLKA